MAAAPKISVVVPFYNAGRFLAQAVDSVRAQTFRGWELILVDDASTDASRALARRLAGAGKIRVLAHRRRQGAFAARLTGAENARARLLALLDADDEWHPRLLEERLASYREAFGARPGIAYGPGVFVWEDGAPRDLRIQRVPKPGVYAPPRLLRDFIADCFVRAPLTTGTLVHRAIVLEATAHAAQARPGIEDLYLWLHAALRYPAVVDAKPLFWYRRHPKSHFARIVSGGRFARLRERQLRWLLRHLKDSGLDQDRRLARAVEAARTR